MWVQVCFLLLWRIQGKKKRRTIANSKGLAREAVVICKVYFDMQAFCFFVVLDVSLVCSCVVALCPFLAWLLYSSCITKALMHLLWCDWFRHVIDSDMSECVVLTPLGSFQLFLVANSGILEVWCCNVKSHIAVASRIWKNSNAAATRWDFWYPSGCLSVFFSFFMHIYNTNAFSCLQVLIGKSDLIAKMRSRSRAWIVQDFDLKRFGRVEVKATAGCQPHVGFTCGWVFWYPSGCLGLWGDMLLSPIHSVCHDWHDLVR